MDILSDSKRALRRVLAQRGLTAVVVATLAAGIGANATVWSWMEALVRRPLPGVARQEELAVLVSNQGGGNVSQLDFRDFADLDRVFAGALMTQMTFASLEVDDRPEWVNTEIVSAGFFDVLGAQARLGRFFRPDEDRTPGGDAVLVISERLWRRRFGADPAVIGRAVELNRHAFTIVGVAAAPFRGSMSAMAFDVWAPSSMIWEVRNQRLEGRAARGWHNLFRLRPGVSVAQAAAAAETLNAQLAMAYPETNRGTRHRLVAMPDCPTGAQAVMGPVLRLLQAVSLGVLLIVAVNVASLSLAGAAGRRKELAIQLALGASRGRLVRGLMLESLVRAVLGGALGLVLATQLTSAISVFLPAAPAGVELDTPIDSSTLVFTLLLTIATGLTIGLVTAIAATRIPLEESLKAGGRSSSAAGPPRLRNALVAAEVALSLVLLVGAGLCLQGLRRARTVDLGLDPDHVLTARLQIGMNGYTPQTGLGFYRELRRRLAATAGSRGGRARELVPSRPLRVQGLGRLRRRLRGSSRRGHHLRVRDRLGALFRRAADPGPRGTGVRRAGRPARRARGGRQPGLRRALLARPGPARAAVPHARRVADDRRPHADGPVQPSRRGGAAVLLAARPAGRARAGPRGRGSNEGRPGGDRRRRCAAPCGGSTPASTSSARCRCGGTSRECSSPSAWPPTCCSCSAPCRSDWPGWASTV